MDRNPFKKAFDKKDRNPFKKAFKRHETAFNNTTKKLLPTIPVLFPILKKEKGRENRKGAKVKGNEHGTRKGKGEREREKGEGKVRKER